MYIILLVTIHCCDEIIPHTYGAHWLFKLTPTPCDSVARAYGSRLIVNAPGLVNK